MIALGLAACVEDGSVVAPPEVDLSGVPSTLRRDAAFEVLDVYVTSPGTVPNGGLDPILDDAVIALIDAANVSIDAAIYEFTRPPVIDALVAAHQRGVQVRYVGDGDEIADEGYVALQAAGVPMVLRPERDRIMHDKFVVIDEQIVFTGSTNMSQNDVLRNNNHSLLLVSPALAAQYTVEFEQMFVDAHFGSQKEDLSGFESVEFRDEALTFRFSPQHDPIQTLVREVDQAEISVHFLIFSFTHPALQDALVRARDRGVDVVGVFDEDQGRGRYSVDEALAGLGIPVFIDGNGNSSGFAGGKLHHKLLLVDAQGDDPRVVSGSFNWSDSATDANDENLLVVRDRALASVMHREFCDRLAEATLHPDYQGSVPQPCTDPRDRVFINEIRPNPEGNDRGGEYVEVVNGSRAVIDLSGWSLGDAQSGGRHVFEGTILEPGGAVVVFDSGDVSAIPGGIAAYSGTLSLDNNADRVVLFDADGAPVDVVDYGTAPSGVSFNRSPDATLGASWSLHDLVGTGLGSPGLRADGSPFVVIEAEAVFTLVLNEVMPNPAGTDLGQEYVEIVNLGPDPADLAGWRLGDLADPNRHLFGATVVPPGKAVVVYDRGDHSDVPGAIASTSTNLALNNTGDAVVLRDADGNVRDQIDWTTSREGVAKVRQSDGVAGTPIVDHDTVAPGAVKLSPGRRTDGTAF